MEPTTGYARLGDERIAYQVLGDGSVDVIIAIGFWGSFDVEWEDPMLRLFYQNVAAFSRLIRFDRRGSGASDPIPLDALPPWESEAEEIECVLDAVGSRQAVLVAAGAAGPAGALFAATRPERTRALIIFHATARYLQDDDYPEGIPVELAREVGARIAEEWGTGEALALFFPSRANDRRFQQWYAKLQRSISSPRAVQKYFESQWEADARAILPSITVPTLVLHRTDNGFLPIEHGRYIAEHIPEAKFVALPGTDVAPYWEHPELTLSAMEEFVTGISRAVRSDRQLATVVFTDIVDSTRRAEELGDRRWRTLLDLHDQTAKAQVELEQGHLVKTTGDGILATFDGPGRAIRGATVLQEELDRANVSIRTGIHTGEVEIRGNDVGGIAVHLAARIMAAAGAGEIMVSRTVHDLVVGSDISFEDRGSHALKGIEGEWQLFSVRRPAVPSVLA